MAIESAKAFLKKLSNDESFKKKLEEAASNEEIQKFVKESGFEFTKDEIKQILGDSTELSDGDIEKVAGGSSHRGWSNVGSEAGAAVAAAF